MANSKKISVSWGGGASDMFLVVEDGKCRILNYENDTCEVHHLAGGKNFYVSRSGASGEGYIEDMSTLIPIGGYRVDTFYDGWVFGPSVIEQDGCKIMLLAPTASHTSPRYEEDVATWRSPFVAIRSEGKKKEIFFLNFGEENFLKTVQDILSGKEVLSGRTKTLRKNFFHLGRKIEMELTVVDAFGSHHSLRPWSMVAGAGFLPSSIESVYGSYRLETLFHFQEERYGFYGTQILGGGKLYLTTEYKGNPLRFSEEDFNKAFSHLGWKLHSDGLAYRYEKSSKQFRIVCWKVNALEQMLESKKNLLRSYYDDFRRYMSDQLAEWRWSDIFEYEVEAPQPLFVLEKETFFDEARKGLEKKVKKAFLDLIMRFKKEISDNELLDSLSDETVVTFDDSLNAGNCEPGTRDFSERFLGGVRETTVGELKKFVDRNDVRRVLIHVALRR